jgi:Fe-S cluster biogenesis protein NfuA
VLCIVDGVFFPFVRDERGRLEPKHRKEMNMREDVEKALQKIRPALQADGGDIELVDVADGVVKVKLTGACGGCPMSQMTLKQGVERVLKEQVPEVKTVESV